ncbi:MAG: hypothetical protein A3I31_01890 [Candidatus Colwellbacteria bacterium RIFCSPLOWO2_02_FULL_44_20b]|uniref:Uncharacterized protein n=1 Tax=Candidatus Colwellbacteria bacterium RIFCSPLOWO2_02_FULL_44_20b TaxID=1797691 RepID=A0A1G1Z409_9BACT|nr:MAG: hypothetical protein A3I31_01890 [Candidatus Colwellbacteria bacterium RIFCSPLOWO2_02_FULL_44_20b]
MAYPIEKKEKAVQLRKRGYSLKEVSQVLSVPKNTLSQWLRDIILTQRSKKRLLSKIRIGQLVSAEKKKQKVSEIYEEYLSKARKEIKKLKNDPDITRVLCALLFWCEGNKSIQGGMRFTNSDPRLVKTFLNLLRNSFFVEEKKFRVCIHLHSYHNPEKQIKYWSAITKIPRNQFIKPFLKKNTGKRIRNGYNGCVSLRYYDTKVARKLLATAQVFLEKKGV